MHDLHGRRRLDPRSEPAKDVIAKLEAAIESADAEPQETELDGDAERAKSNG